MAAKKQTEKCRPRYVNEKAGLSYPLKPKGPCCFDAQQPLKQIEEAINKICCPSQDPVPQPPCPTKQSLEVNVRGLCCCLDSNCGDDCPSVEVLGDLPRTFHVPDCQCSRPLVHPASGCENQYVCPFAPACCPLGMKCPFPVKAKYIEGLRPLPPPSCCRCPQPPPPCPILSSQCETSCQEPCPGIPCPLDPIKPLPISCPPKKKCPATCCPPSPKPPCPSASSPSCPLLSCRLGSLMKWIFQGDDECPFCGSPCCTLISSDSLGCPMGKPPKLCTADVSDCALATDNKGCCCQEPPTGDCPPPCPTATLLNKDPKNEQDPCEKTDPNSTLHPATLAKTSLQHTKLAPPMSPVKACCIPPLKEAPPPPKCPYSPPTPKKCCQCSKPEPIQTSPLNCPVKNSPCDMFPEGRCPMTDLNLCSCNYPVAPCLEPIVDGPSAEAPVQYCANLKCCMGLPLPPTKPAAGGEFETGTWYKYMDRFPGVITTKHYVDILDAPPTPKFFVGNDTREHDTWYILKQGEGYKQCKGVQEILKNRGDCSDVGVQFDPKDNVMDLETQIVMKNKEMHEKQTLEALTPWKE